MVEHFRVFFASTWALVVTDGRLEPTLWDFSQQLVEALVEVRERGTNTSTGVRA
jgi:hypothetical protein